MNNKHQLQQKQRSLEALLNFAERINQIESLEDAIWYVTQHTIKALNFEDCVIYLLQDDKVSLKQVAAYGNKNPHQKEIAHSMILKVGEGIVGRAAAEGKNQRIDDTQTCDDYVVDDKVRLSELAVPIIFQNNLLGVIDSEHKQKGFYTAEHERYIEIIASILASKISFDIALKTLEKNFLTIKKSKALSDIYLKISELTYNVTSSDDFYLELHNLISRKLKSHNFSIFLFNEQNDDYLCPFTYDQKLGKQFNLTLDYSAIKNSVINSTIAEQKTKRLNQNDIECLHKKDPLLDSASKVYSWLIVPFKVDHSILGAISLKSYHSDMFFNQQDEKLLHFLSQHISTAIDRKHKSEKLRQQALYDPVTGLANRFLFLDRLKHAYSRAIRNPETKLAVLFIDLDDFKNVNDKLGHEAGDYLLKASAKRISSELRSIDTLARIGGDEFCIVLEDLESFSHSLKISKRILKQLQTPIDIDNESISVSASIGIAMQDEHSQSAEDLLKKSDYAMYYAKRHGKNDIQVYNPEIYKEVSETNNILYELKIAIKENQFTYYFQPIIDLNSNEIVGFEALLRWRHPVKGIITPEKFIDVAEKSGLLKEIDHHLLEKAALYLNHWRKITNKNLFISINISAQRFMNSKLIDDVKKTIQKNKLPPHSIIIEVTEHTLIENINIARYIFENLRKLNVLISLDDFGTGYSSLSYLEQFPFDIIKIDRSFISRLNKSKKENPIVNAIIALAKTMNIKLVAEGIENEFQLDKIKSLECKYGQGNYLSEPINEDETEKLIKSLDSK